MAVFTPCLHRKPEVKSATQGSPPIRKRKKTSPLSIGARSTRGTTLIYSRKPGTSFRSGNGDQPSRSSRATRKWLAMLPPQGFHRPLLSIDSLHSLASSLRYLIGLIILSKYFPSFNIKSLNSTIVLSNATLISSTLSFVAPLKPKTFK